MSSLLPNGKQYFTDQNGNPLANGQVYMYIPNTSTYKNTYQDSAQTILNTNPIVLDQFGEAIIWGTGTYRQVVYDVNNNLIYDQITSSNVQSSDLGNTTGSGGTSLIGFNGGTLADYLRNSSDIVVNSIAALRALDHTLFTKAFVDGYYVAGDGGGGFYYFDSTDLSSADNGGTVIVASDGARWKLFNTGTVTIRQFGAKGNGTTNDTVSVQNAANAGINIFCPPGTYLIDSVGIPPSNGRSFTGSGVRQTTFVANTSNVSLFYYNGPTNSSVESAQFGNFAVKANAAGSTVTAVNLCGFRDSSILPIEGLSNGTAGFISIMDLAAYPALCFNNVIYHPRLYGQTGWANGVRFTNGGSGSGLNNANINTIVAPWIVDCVGMSYAIDASRSTKTTIENGLIEGNTGATYIRMGQATTVRDNWLEHRAGDSAPYFEFGQVVNEYKANDGLVEGNFIGPTQVVVNFNSVCAGNIFIKNRTEAGPIQFVNSPGRSNVLLDIYELYNPSLPTFTKTSGAAGTLNSATVTVAKNLDQFGHECVFQINASYTPTATGLVTFQVQVSPLVTPATQGTMQLIEMGGSSHDANTGAVQVTGYDNAGAVRVNFTSTTAMSVQVWARYVLVGAGNP